MMSSAGGPKRVLFVSHEATRTGAPMFLLHLMRWLRAETNLQFELLCGRGGPLLAEFAKVTKVFAPSDREAATATRGVDLIYSNTCFNGDLLDTLGCGEVPVITHVHELDSGYEWAGAPGMAACLRQTSHFVACSEAVRRRLRLRFDVPDAQCSRHYEMIDAPAVLSRATAADPAEVRRRFDLPTDGFVVVGCGTFDLRKGVDLFVQAAHRLVAQAEGRPVHFVWAGAFNARDLRVALEEDVRKLGLSGVVRFAGELPDPSGLLALADVFWLTSREDPFPLAMLEAAALGKPVICFEGAGGGPEFCGLGGGVSVPYLDCGAIAVATRELMQEPERRREIGRRAAELSGGKFTITAVVPGLWTTMQAVLSGSVEFPPATQRRLALTDIYARWRPEHAPQRAFVATHLARQAARTEAKALARKGRGREAVQLLVKTITDDLASKDPWITCEGLVQIGESLAEFDAKQSAQLLERAATLAKSASINLNPFRSKPLA